MAPVSLRVRHDGGQGVVKGLDPLDSVEKLVSHSMEVLGLEQVDLDRIKMLSGFPPKPLDISDRDRSIDSLGVRNGDTIIFQNLQTGPPSTSSSSATSSTSTTPPSTAKSEGNFAFGPKAASEGPTEAKRTKTEPSLAKMERQVVPADNSCLFTAINYCMSGSVVPSANSSFMREVIAAEVSADQEKYSEAFLGRANKSYCEWILGKDAWGGGIEVQILAEYFQVEILVVDTVSGSRTVFGEGRDFPQRMVLIYDGIHYDPLHLREADGERKTVQSSKDVRVEGLALALAKEARAQHQYTDTKGFTLKCLVCGIRMKGEAEAQQHATQTKHTNFSEV